MVIGIMNISTKEIVETFILGKLPKLGMLHENKRTYIFPHGEFEVNLVRQIQVSKSGGHRLTCKSGLMVYVPSGWMGIFINSKHGWEQ